ncbi:MAG TPA: DUF4097 family beta strand repeat-containing protein [Hyphomicrobiales bacterium]|nr:DUF4097 family beta strand repeat-containing protein [Hyphomicrobiales bacterium]
MNARIRTALTGARVPRGCLLLAALFTAPLLHAGEAIDETRPVDENGVISIELVNGFVRLVAWDRAEFHVSGELSDNASGFELRERGSGLRFEETFEPDGNTCFGFFGCQGRSSRSDGADLLIEVPRNGIVRLKGTNIDVEVSQLERNTEVELINGEISADRLKGVVKLNTVNGDIRATGLDGQLALETVNGRIADRESSGSRIDLRTVNGGIESNSRSERIRVDNVNGGIDLTLGNIDDLEVSTVGGQVDIRTALNPLAQLQISSVHGRIDVALPAATSATFLVSTAVGGRIANELSNDEPVRRSRFVNSSDLNFVLGGGESDVRISTVSGSVRLCEAEANSQRAGC